MWRRPAGGHRCRRAPDRNGQRGLRGFVGHRGRAQVVPGLFGLFGDAAQPVVPAGQELRNRLRGLLGTELGNQGRHPARPVPGRRRDLDNRMQVARGGAQLRRVDPQIGQRPPPREATSQQGVDQVWHVNCFEPEGPRTILPEVEALVRKLCADRACIVRPGAGRPLTGAAPARPGVADNPCRSLPGRGSCVGSRPRPVLAGRGGCA
jgi:hypothetical protein